MRKNCVIMIMSVCAMALGGCAVSPGGFSTGGSVAESGMAPSPASPVVLASKPASDLPLAKDASGKFAKSDAQSLVVDETEDTAQGTDAEFQQAYAEALEDFAPIRTEHVDLQPYVGRWQLNAKGAGEAARAQQIEAYSRASDACEVVLEDIRAGYGYKATGNASCPTSLFMLDSWVPFDGRIVLRDHMGDEIVKLRSDGEGVWVGVNNEGNMLVLKKS
nr:AprI/Inh family metalloprotease inhibitor [uncultured Cohaesibacter sp.]